MARGGAAFDEADALPLVLERTSRRAEVSPAAILAFVFGLRATRTGTNRNSEGKSQNRDRRDYAVRCRVDDDDRRVKTLFTRCISAGAVRRDGNIIDQEAGRDSGNHGIGRGVDDEDRHTLIRHVCAATVRRDGYAYRKQTDRDSGNHSVGRRGSSHSRSQRNRFDCVLCLVVILIRPQHPDKRLNVYHHSEGSRPDQS